MKRFAFTLQRMLAFKTTMYEKERNTLAQLRAERLTVEMRRDDTLGQMLTADAAFKQKAQSGVTVREANEANFMRESAQRLVEQLEAIMARMDIEIERQLQVVIALDKEVQSLEKLRESQWEEYQMEAAAEEKDRILEIVSRRFADDQAASQEEEEKELRLAAQGA